MNEIIGIERREEIVEAISRGISKDKISTATTRDKFDADDLIFIGIANKHSERSRILEKISEKVGTSL